MLFPGMNILLITQEDYLAGSTYSVSYLATGLAGRGHRVFVAARAGSLLQHLLQNTEVTFVPVTLRSRFSIGAIAWLRRFILDHQIEIINAQSSKDRYVSIFAKWAHRFPVTVVHTRRQYPRSDGGWAQSWFYSVATDGIVVISHELREIFTRKGYRASRLKVIHNGIPEGKYKSWSDARVAELRALFELQPSDIVIGCVSRLKRQEQIIRSLVTLNRPLVKVILVGVVPGYFDELVRELGIKNPIIYVASAEGTDVLNYYRLFTLNVLASVTDGFGLVLLESMAMGCPVVATNFGGIKDVVKHQRNGLLFNDGDTRELAAQMLQVMNSAVLRERLISNGYNTAFRQFPMQKTLDNYEQYFAKLIAHQQAGRVRSVRLDPALDANSF